MSTRPQPDYLMLARILRPHGIRGDLRVQIVTSAPERLVDMEQIWIGPAAESPLSSRKALAAYPLAKARHDKGDNYLIHIKGVDDRTAAEAFRDLCLYIPFAQAVPLEQDEYYMFQLIGLRVETDDGRDLGKLESVLETGANDVFIVKGESYGEVLIPVIDGVIRAVDLDGGKITVALPNGLLDADEV